MALMAFLQRYLKEKQLKRSGKMKLPSHNIQILVAAVVGVVVGLYFHSLGADNGLVKGCLYTAGIVGTLFIDLLKMILIPLVFCSIAVGIANLRQHQQMHRVWITTLVFFTFTTTIAVALGLVASNYFKPGTGMQIAMFADAMGVVMRASQCAFMGNPVG